MTNESEKCWLASEAHCDVHCFFITFYGHVYKTVAKIIFKKCLNSLELECRQCDTKPIVINFRYIRYPLRIHIYIQLMCKSASRLV